MSPINWSRVASAVASPAGLHVVERRPDGTLGPVRVLAPQRKAAPIPRNGWEIMFDLLVQRPTRR